MAAGDVHIVLHDREPIERRNRRTAVLLVGWIALLAVLSLIVIWLRN
jgi:hypothetical protein